MEKSTFTNFNLTKRPPKSKSQLIEDLNLGRKAPQDIEIEKAVLSALMIDKEAIDEIREILVVDSFYLPAHQYIYKAALDLSIKGEPIDLSTLGDQLSKNNHFEAAGGSGYLIELSNVVMSSANIEFHSRIIAQKYIQRELILLGNETIKNAFDSSKDVFDLLDETESKIYHLADNYNSKDPVNASFILHEAIEELQHRISRNKDGGLQGVETGFKKLNELSGGWQKGDLIIVAGRPGMGKTAFALTLARNAAVDAKKTVAVFSLEMPINQLMMRLISSESEIEMENLRKGDISNAQLQEITTKMGSLQNVKLFFDETPSLSIMDFRKKVRKIKRDHELDLIVIDYLQLMTSLNTDKENKVIGNREQEISYISRSLKSIAKELEVPVIALAQLSRQVEVRGGNSTYKRPMLSDLRESGAIEQDADMVIFLFRENYYAQGKDADPENQIPEDEANISVAKNRNGRTEDFKVKFISKYVKYQDEDGNSSFANFRKIDNKKPDDFETGNNSKVITMASKMNDDDRDSSFLDDELPPKDEHPDD